MTCSHGPIVHVTSGRREECGCQSDGLIEFGGAMPYYPPADRETYLVRGQWVHAACLTLAQGQEPPIAPTLAAVERIRKISTEGWTVFLDGFRLWLSMHDVKFIDGEVKVTHKTLGYHGKYDLKLIVDGKLSRIDLKTGFKIPNYTPLQLALYDLADERTQRIGLLLRPDGRYEEYGQGKEPPYCSYADYGQATALATWYWGRKRYQ